MRSPAVATLEGLATYALKSIRPVARGEALAAELRQLGELAGNLPLTLVDVSIAYGLLQRPGPGDDARVTQRRFTCADIARSAGPFANYAWEKPLMDRARTRMAAVLDALIAGLTPSADPRHRAMGETARRESAELRAGLAAWA